MESCRSKVETTIKSEQRRPQPHPLTLQPVAATILAHLTLAEQKPLLGAICPTWDREIEFNLVKGRTIHLTTDSTATKLSPSPSARVPLQEFMLNSENKNHLYTTFVLHLSQDRSDSYAYSTFLTNYGWQIRNLSVLWRNQLLSDEVGSSGAEFVLRNVFVERKVPNLHSLTIDLPTTTTFATQWPSSFELHHHTASDRLFKNFRHLTLLTRPSTEPGEGNHYHWFVEHLLGILCPPGHMHLLESLHIQYCCGYSLEQLLQLRFPALKSFKMCGDNNEWIDWRLEPPHLTALGTAFPMLEELQIKMACFGATIPPACFSSACFPHLRRLTIEFLPVHYYAEILFEIQPTLDSLVLVSPPPKVLFDTNMWPNLTKLSVYRTRRRCSRIARELGWTDSGSYKFFPNLKVLNLTGQFMPAQPPEELRTIISSMPHLEDLRLIIDSYSEPAMTGLTLVKCRKICESMAGLTPAFLKLKLLRTRTPAKKDGLCISQLKRLKRLELTTANPGFSIYAGILYGVTDCSTLEHLNLDRFRLGSDPGSGLIFKAIANKLKNLRWLDMTVVSMTESIEQALSAAIPHVNINFYDPSRPR